MQATNSNLQNLMAADEYRDDLRGQRTADQTLHALEGLNNALKHAQAKAVSVMVNITIEEAKRTQLETGRFAAGEVDPSVLATASAPILTPRSGS